MITDKKHNIEPTGGQFYPDVIFLSCIANQIYLSNK